MARGTTFHKGQREWMEEERSKEPGAAFGYGQKKIMSGECGAPPLMIELCPSSLTYREVQTYKVKVSTAISRLWEVQSINASR